MLNVFDYGARGDGSTDDTAAVQAAINAAMNAGDALEFPARTYLIAGFLSVPAAVTLQGARTRALGNSSSLRFTGDGGGAWSRGQNGLVRVTAGGTKFIGITCEVVNQSAGACLFNFSNATGEVSGIKLEDCTLVGGGAQSTNTLLWGWGVDNIRLRDCTFQYAAQHLTFGPHTVANLVIDGCIFTEGTDLTKYMLDLNLGGNSFGCSVANNIFELYYTQLAARINVNNGCDFAANYIGDGPGSTSMTTPTVMLGGNGPINAQSNFWESSTSGRYLIGVHCALGGAKIQTNSIQGGTVFITGRATLERNSINGTVLLNSAEVLDLGNSFRGAGHSYQNYSAAQSKVKGFYEPSQDLTSLKIDQKLTTVFY
jgi:hypothetical protein